MNRLKSVIGIGNVPRVPEDMQPMMTILKFKFRVLAIPGIPLAKLTPIEQAIVGKVHRYSKQDIKRVKELLIEEKQPHEILKDIVKFPMEPDVELLFEIGQKIGTVKVTDILAYGIFYEALAWVAADYRSDEFFMKLIGILNEITEKDSTGPYEKEICFVFSTILASFLNDSSLTMTDEVCATISSHLFVNPGLGPGFQPLFDSFVKSVVQSKMKGSITHILKITQRFVYDNRCFVVLADQAPLLAIVCEMARHLDISAIELVCSVATPKYEVSTEILELFNRLPDRIVDLLKSDKPFYEKMDVDTDEEHPRAAPALECQFLDVPPMNYNPTNVVPVELCDQQVIKARDFVPGLFNMKQLHFLAGDFSKVSVRYLKVFFDSFSRCVEKHLTSDYYLDIYSVFLFLASKLGEHVSLASYSSALLSPVVLNRNVTIFGGMTPTIMKFRAMLFDTAALSEKFYAEILCYTAKRSPWLFAETAFRVLVHLDSIRLEMFCTEHTLTALANVAIDLQRIYVDDHSEQVVKARTACFMLMFKIISDSTAFLMASALSCFAHGYLSFLFEPGMSDVVLSELAAGFMTSDSHYRQPIYVQFVLTIGAIVDACSKNTGNPQYDELAKKLLNCTVKCLSNNTSLAYSFGPLFTALLYYIDSNPESELLMKSFEFLSISSQFIPNFHFSSEIFRLLAGLIKKVGVDDPPNSLRARFVGLLSGSNNTSERALYVIKQPVFIPLMMVAYSESPELMTVINDFTALCKHSPANCIACHEGDLDFLLLEMILSRDRAVKFYGYTIHFKIEDSAAIPSMLALIGLIIRVKTSSVICDRLLRLVSPESGDFSGEYVDQVLEILNGAISADSVRRRPMFDLWPSRLLCEVTGLTDKEANDNVGITFWLNIDVAQLLQTNESFDIFLLESANGAQKFRLFANSGKIMICYSTSGMTVSAVFTSSIPSNEWTNYSLLLRKLGTEQTSVEFFQFHEMISTTAFPKIEFPPGDVRFIIGGNRKDLKGSRILHPTGIIGPFAYLNGMADDEVFTTYPFHSDPNFERIPDTLFTSNLIFNSKEGGGIQITVFDDKSDRDGFLGTMSHDYDLNHLVNLLGSFKPEDKDRALSLLKVIMGCLTCYLPGQAAFYSVPLLACLIPRTFSSMLNYNFYTLFFNFLTGCVDIELQRNVLDNIILNISIWIRSDVPSLCRIVYHWSTAIIATFKKSFTDRWTVRRLISHMRILFFSNHNEVTYETGTETGIQNDLLTDVNEYAMPFSCDMFHSHDESIQVRDAYIRYISAVASTHLTGDDVDTLFSSMFKTDVKEYQLVYLEIIRQIGSKISTLTGLKFSPIVPIQSFFNTQDTDLIIAGILALCELAGDNVHFALSTASIQVLMNAELDSVFSKLVELAPEQPNLFSLICVLALSMGSEEQKTAIKVLHSISDKSKGYSERLSIDIFAFLWPLALGLVVDEPAQVEVADFVALMIFQEHRLVERFSSLIYTINFLAGWEAPVAAATLSRTLTTVVCRDMGYSMHKNRQELNDILLVAFRSMYTHIVPVDEQVEYSFLHPVLRSSYDTSCFAETSEHNLSRKPLIKSFMNFIQLCSKPPPESKLHFYVRMDANGTWIDQQLAPVLLSMVSMCKPNALLLAYQKLTNYFLAKLNSGVAMDVFIGLPEIVDEIMKNVQTVNNKEYHKRLNERCASVRNLISEGISGIPESIQPNSDIVTEKEITLLHKIGKMARENRKRILRELVYQRDSSWFLSKEKRFFYSRDDTRCFVFCPAKLLPSFDDQKQGYREYRLISPTDKQIQVKPPSTRRRSSTLSCYYKCVLIKLDQEIACNVEFRQLEWALEIDETNEVWRYKYNDIEFAFPRARYQKMTAVELFLQDGTSYLIDFSPETSETMIARFGLGDDELESMLSELTQRWVSGKMSNFGYLMRLNLFAGRSFDDLTQYPILPNLLANGSSRCLSKPIHADDIDVSSLTKEELEAESVFCESVITPDAIDTVLARVEPFCSIHFRNNGSKELADADILSRSEFLPELFFQPEILVDRNNLGFSAFPGVSNPLEYVYNLRKLLESDEVSENLPGWIDFVFGYRQKGDAAAEIGNIRHPFTLDNVWDSESTNLLKAPDQVFSMMRIYGAMPRQIFQTSHPHKQPASDTPTTQFIHTVSSVAITFACKVLQKFWIVTADGLITPVEIDLSAEGHLVKSPPLSIAPSYLTDNTLIPFDEGILSYSQNNNRIYLIAGENVIEGTIPPVDNIISSEMLFVTIRNRTSMTLYHVESFPDQKAHIATTEDVIECFAVSYDFHLLCFASRDERLHFLSLNDFRQAMVVELPIPSAKRIIISKTSGFVVVDFGKDMLLFTVNGTSIGSYSHEFELAYWTAVASPSDFDYIVYVDLKGSLFVFNIYEPSRTEKLAQIPWPVCFIDYDNENDCLFVVSTNGKVMLIRSPLRVFCE